MPEPEAQPDKLAGVATIEAAGAAGRGVDFAVPNGRTEAAQVAVDESADFRLSLSNLSLWERDHCRKLRMAESLCPIVEFQPLFSIAVDTIGETARGYRGYLLNTVLTHTLHFKGDKRGQAARRLLGPPRRDRQEEFE